MIYDVIYSIQQNYLLLFKRHQPTYTKNINYCKTKESFNDTAKVQVGETSKSIISTWLSLSLIPQTKHIVVISCCELVTNTEIVIKVACSH